MQVISQKQLMEALQNQQGKMKGKKIGAILLRCGYIGRHHIKDVLRVQKPDLSEDELELEISDDPTSITMDYYKAPKLKYPNISVAILSVNGHSSEMNLRYWSEPLGGCQIVRQQDETDEQMAKRTGQEIEQEVLMLLKKFPDKQNDEPNDNGATAEYLRNFLREEPSADTDQEIHGAPVKGSGEAICKLEEQSARARKDPTIIGDKNQQGL